MEEKDKHINVSQQQEKFEKEDNRLPYEKPKLRKHGKVNDTTTTSIFSPLSIDGFRDFTDFS